MARLALIITLSALLSACSDRQVEEDAGATDGPALDKKVKVDRAPDKKGPPADGPQTKCPATKPAEGAKCTGKLVDCEYLIQKCYCGPSDIMWHCNCTGGVWKCGRDYDCYPCDGSVPDSFFQKDGKLTCPPMPSCNWCGGTMIKDKNGCGVGYKCANGVDPCKVPPCSASSCKASEYCGKDSLCWPKKDSGPPTPDTGTVSCKNGICSGSSAGDCGCEWTCSNGNKYKVDCKQTTPSSKDCKCLLNGAQVKTCVYPGSTMGCSPASLATCCGFPN